MLDLKKTESWILAHHIQKPTCQNTQLCTWHLPLCSMSLRNILLSLIILHLQSVLLSHSSTLLYLALPQFINCLYHCYLWQSGVDDRGPLSSTPDLITAILSTCTINSLSLNYPISSRSRTLAPTVVKAPKFCHITCILSCLHWHRITECIEYKLLSLTYKVLTSTLPPYLHNLISVQRLRSTRSTSVVTLARPPLSSSLKITDHSFHYASPCLWNQLPLSLCHLHSGTSSSISDSPILSPVTFPFVIHHSAHP